MRIECNKCGIVKEHSDFYKNRRVCKKCIIAHRIKWQKENRDKYNQYLRTFTRRNSSSEKMRVRRKNLYEKYKKSGKTFEWIKRSKGIRIKEYQAISIANRALNRGEILRSGCVRMDMNCYGRMEMHHEDYDKPLDVIWFCRYHHGLRHRELNDLKRGVLVEQN